MSTNLNYKQVNNVERRTWNLDVYANKADGSETASDKDGNKKKHKKKRNQAGELITLGPQDETGTEEKEEFQSAAKGAAGPLKSERAFLKARRNRVDVDSKIGSVEVVNPDAAATTKSQVSDSGSPKDGITKTGVGWHCKVCDCFLRDSHTYLDHINGRKHQRNLGYSMRVERSSKDQVKSRLAQLAKEKESQRNKLVDETEDRFYDIVKAKDEEARLKKEERARQRKERKRQKREAKSVQANEDQGDAEGDEPLEDTAETDEVEDGMNPDMAAIMGFSGFGGGNKN